MTTCALCGEIITPVILKLSKPERDSMSPQQYALSCLSAATAQHVQTAHKEFAAFAYRLSQQTLGYAIASVMKHTGEVEALYANPTRAEGELLMLYLLKLPASPSVAELERLHKKFHAEVTENAVADIKADSELDAQPGVDGAPPEVIQ